MISPPPTSSDPAAGQPTAERPRVAVLVGGDLVGDGLLKLPFVRALAAALPMHERHWLTSRGTTVYAGLLAPLVAGLLDAVHETPPWLPLPNTEASPAPWRYDIILDTRNRWRHELAARALRPRLFVGQSWHYLLSDRRPALGAPRPAHMVARLLQQLELAVGPLPPLAAVPPLAIPATLLATARTMLPAGPTYVAIAPGAGDRRKCWPLTNFLALAAALKNLGKIPVWLLGPAEQEWVSLILAADPAALLPLQSPAWAPLTAGQPALSILATLATAQQCQSAVANDSGVGHMLAAADVPLLSLFGPTNSAKLAPHARNLTVLRAQDYPQLSSNIMENLPLSAVLTTLEKISAAAITPPTAPDCARQLSQHREPDLQL